MKVNLKPVKKILYWILFVLVIVIAAFIYFKYAFDYSKGYRAGLLQKFSEKGVVFKTYEADHWPTKLRDKQDFQIRMAQFFDYYLKGEPMPKWMKVGIPAVEKKAP